MDGFQTYIPAATKNCLNDRRYHVFLSFRGKDVRKTLVDHLSQALSAAGLEVFLDSDKLKKGEIIDSCLENAIMCSAICIPIFSKGYASSAWCLKEAALMLASSGLIIPLFHEMEPTHVRYPLGDSSPYKKSFEKHYNRIPDRHSREEIDGWKDALEEICSRSGWSLDMTGGFEAQLVKNVVNDIIKTLNRVPLQAAKHPVGLETMKKAILQKLQGYRFEPVKIGIWGIGGIGKTTVAKAVYNEAYIDFKASSFIFNVRATSLTKLQGQLLKDLVNYTEEVYSVNEGISLLKDRLGAVPALVVLDDVDDPVQLDALALYWLSTGSRVIITSRDRHILSSAYIFYDNIFEMSGLGKSEGLQLFSWHAFLRPSPVPRYEELSERIVEACKGHPLSLEVIGAFLYDKQDDTDIDCWNETLHNIILNRDIFETLKISYSGLSAEEKQIFVDIACYFIGECTFSPLVFWKSMYKKVHTSITNLSMKLLIKIGENGVFEMHDLVRDMGRIIAEEDQTRQWDSAQSSSLFNNASTINISRLHLRGGDSRCLEMLCTRSLCYLHLEQVNIQGGIDSLPPTLRWLKLDSCSFASKKDSSNLFKDLILAMKKKYTSVVGSISQLRILELTDCRSLQNFPDGIGNLSLLQSLNLSECQKLECLPSSIGKLSELLYLNLSYCENLRHLPDSIGNLSKLKYFNLTCCKILIRLPNSIGKLSQLNYLSLSWCKKLQNLPESFSKLSKLERLDMLSCYAAWKSIPYAILIQPKLRLLGLPPQVDNWRKSLIDIGCAMEALDQMEQQAMVEFSAILTPACQKLESKLTKIRLLPRKSFFQNRSRLRLKSPGETTKEELDSAHQESGSDGSSYNETQPMDTMSTTNFSTEKSFKFVDTRSYPEKLESKLTKIRFFPRKSFFQNRSRLRLKSAGETTKVTGLFAPARPQSRRSSD